MRDELGRRGFEKRHEHRAILVKSCGHKMREINGARIRLPLARLEVK